MFNERPTIACSENFCNAPRHRRLHRLPLVIRPTAVAILGSALMLLGPAPAWADTTVLNTFNADVGTWTTASGNHADGFNFDWSNTGNASGLAGEVGGTFARLNGGAPGALGMPRILDTQSFVGQSVSLKNDLTITGKLWMHDPGTAVSTIHLGYYNSADPSGQRFVLRLVEPGSLGSKLWRVRFGGPGASGTRTTLPDTTWDSASLDFNLHFTPSGLNDGTGTMTGTLMNGATPFPVTPFAIAANTATFDSFGIWVDSNGSTNPLDIQSLFVDSVTFTVPEPSTVLLWALGLGGLLLRFRKRIVARE